MRKYVVRLTAVDRAEPHRRRRRRRRRQTTVTGLDNEAEQSVQVQAWNELGAGPFGPSVTMQSAGTPPALAAPVDRGERPGPGARTRRRWRISWEQGRPNGPPITGVHPLPLGRRRRLDRRRHDLARRAARARDVIPYDGRTYRYVATVTNGADLESPQSNPSSFTSNGIPSTPTRAARRPRASNREIRLTVGVGQPRGGGVHGHPLVGRRQVGHPRVRLRARLAGRVLGRAVRHQPDEELHDHGVDGELRWRGVEPGQRLGDPLRRHADPRPVCRAAAAAPTSPGRGTCRRTAATIDQVEFDGAVNGTFGRHQDLGELNGQRGAGTYRLRVRAHSAAGLVGLGRPSVRHRSPTRRPRSTTCTRAPATGRPNGSGTCAVRPARGSTSTCATSRRRRWLDGGRVQVQRAEIGTSGGSSSQAPRLGRHRGPGQRATGTAPAPSSRRRQRPARAAVTWRDRATGPGTRTRNQQPRPPCPARRLPRHTGTTHERHSHDRHHRPAAVVRPGVLPDGRQRRPGGARQAARHPAGADLHALRGPPAARGLPGHRQDPARPGDRQHGAGHATRGSSSPPTCCPATSPA